MTDEWLSQAVYIHLPTKTCGVFNGAVKAHTIHVTAHSEHKIKFPSELTQAATAILMGHRRSLSVNVDTCGHPEF